MRHFRLVVGYEPDTDSVLYLEPAEDDPAYRRMHRADLLREWPLKYDRDRWTVIRFALDAAHLAAPPRRPKPTPADYVQRVMQMQTRAGPSFSVAVEPPFIVIGDASRQRVRSQATGLVRWTTERLRRDFFARDPDGPLEVWLFSSADGYYGTGRRLFGEPPDTPFGYYSAEQRALVMNIATGGGTLVHELVHPYMEANAPNSPPWLNEGLASLFEASGDADGHIVGRVNWRLGGLQRAVKTRRVLPFHRLFTENHEAFHADDAGVRYAESRYLLYYLQQQGRLVSFFKRWLATRATDPTGEGALLAESGEPDLTTFQAKWETFVLGLRESDRRATGR